MANLVPFNWRNKGLTNTDDFYGFFDSFFNDPWFAGRRFARDTFNVDVQETEKEYLVEAELPGVNKEQITVELMDGNLSIAINREDNINQENKNYIHRERRYSSMRRNIYLGDATSEGIHAKLDNGVLKISVPRQKRIDDSKRIKIE
ncbi:MAG: Hsp20/alpha crystallin family protein [Christensenellales bacterium]